VGDAFHDFGIDLNVSVPVVLVIFAMCAFIYMRRARSSDATVQVNSAYWVCMMLAGVLGTIGGDFVSYRLGLTALGAAIVCGLLITASIAWFGRRGTLLSVGPYWLTVALIRTGGTALGDAVAHAVKLPLSTALTGAVFIGLVVYFYALRSSNEIRAVARA
jgi:uncharacterized membrane-anchored protein